MIFGHCHSDDTKADLEDNNDTTKLSNFSGFWTLIHKQKKALLEVGMLKEGALQ